MRQEDMEVEVLGQSEDKEAGSESYSWQSLWGGGGNGNLEDLSDVLSSPAWEDIPELMEMFYTCAVQYGGQQPHVNFEELNFKIKCVYNKASKKLEVSD